MTMMNPQQSFDIILENCRKLSDFAPTDAQLALLREAYNGIFKHGGKGMRKSPLSWAGLIGADGKLSEKHAKQSLHSAFCRLFHYHLGRDGGCLGTVINATENLAHCAEAFGLCPHDPNSFAKWYRLPDGHPDLPEARRKSDENKAATRGFADLCDTFIQVAIYISSNGKTSTVAGDRWRKALGV